MLDIPIKYGIIRPFFGGIFDLSKIVHISDAFLEHDHGHWVSFTMAIQDSKEQFKRTFEVDYSLYKSLKKSAEDRNRKTYFKTIRNTWVIVEDHGIVEQYVKEYQFPERPEDVNGYWEFFATDLVCVGDVHLKKSELQCVFDLQQKIDVISQSLIEFKMENSNIYKPFTL